MNRLAAFVCILFFTSCCKKVVQNDHLPQSQSAENIILLIGDGMGLGQITAGMIVNDNYTALEEFEVIGLHKSFSYDDLITDSAAGATAFACGVKTYNGAIGVNADTIPVKTILEEAEEKGMATGLVATSTIVHATPACFISHNPHRRNYEEIAADFLKTDIDFFVGGGKKFFDRRTLDDRNLIAELQAKGYQISDYFSEDFKDVRITKDKFGYFTADEDPLPVLGGRDYLLEASKKAVYHLSKKNDKGFFLMIEGSQIDWGGHANMSEYIVSEFLEFNKVIKEMVKWADKDKNTLVIVTADHETGGYSINKGSTKDTLVTAFTTDYHTGTMIPVFAHGPGAHQFSGIYENTAIYNKMRKALKWESLTDGY